MIRNSLYTKHGCEICSLSEKLRDTLDNLPSCDDETMEETKIKNALYKAEEALAEAKRAIEYFSKDTNEGILEKSYYGKFFIKFKDGSESYLFSCGSSIEVYLEDGKWHAGRVEGRMKDGECEYYFYGSGNSAIYEGMKARIRV